MTTYAPPASYGPSYGPSYAQAPPNPNQHQHPDAPYTHQAMVPYSQDPNNPTNPINQSMVPYPQGYTNQSVVPYPQGAGGPVVMGQQPMMEPAQHQHRHEHHRHGSHVSHHSHHSKRHEDEERDLEKRPSLGDTLALLWDSLVGAWGRRK